MYLCVCVKESVMCVKGGSCVWRMGVVGVNVKGVCCVCGEGVLCVCVGVCCRCAEGGCVVCVEGVHLVCM